MGVAEAGSGRGIRRPPLPHPATSSPHSRLHRAGAFRGGCCPDESSLSWAGACIRGIPEPPGGRSSEPPWDVIRVSCTGFGFQTHSVFFEQRGCSWDWLLPIKTNSTLAFIVVGGGGGGKVVGD